MLTTLISAMTLSACGGGGDLAMDGGSGAAAQGGAMPATVLAASATVTSSSAAVATVTQVATPTQLGAGAAVLSGIAVAPAPAASTVTGVTALQLASTATVPQVNVPVTFGQVFRAGDVKSTESLTGKLATGASVPLQVDVKARHPDGSLRHAVVSSVLPNLMPGQTHTLNLVKSAAPQAAAAGASPAALLNAGFSAVATITLNGKQYSASAESLLKGGYAAWLAGPVANEWLVSAPLKTAQGEAHPHLSARFAIRAYPGNGSARVDVTLENDWAYEPAPQNFTYDAQITVGGKPAFSKTALTHFHHARWRRTFWWGATPLVNIKHNAAYLIASKAVPNYDSTIVVRETTLAAMKKSWTGAMAEPMGTGLAAAYMPMTGGRQELGLLPGWNAVYVLSTDQRAKDVSVAMSEQAGSWPAHYRNKLTGRPVTLQDFPYMTIVGRPTDTLNPVTKKYESFPLCPTTLCATTLVPDTAHQPSFSYVPYMVTGDHYHLEELQFWAMWNAFSSNPYYRGYTKGLLTSNQVRSQGWTMRTLGQAAFITPDSDPLKAQFTAMLDHNLDWYNSTYSNNAAANPLGAITHGDPFQYENGTAIAPWQDDFFTSAIGHLDELGFAKAKPLLTYKAKFPVNRMVGAGTCWITAAAYSMKLRNDSKSPLYTTMAQVYQNTNKAEFNLLGCNTTQMAYSLGLKVGEMTGYSSSPGGYPSYLQSALAYTPGVNSQGLNAWKLLMSRSVKPDYNAEPQFAIVPR